MKFDGFFGLNPSAPISGYRKRRGAIKMNVQTPGKGLETIHLEPANNNVETYDTPSLSARLGTEPKDWSEPMYHLPFPLFSGWGRIDNKK